MLPELKQRIRDVRQGPDGLFYLVSEEIDGSVLKVEHVISSPRGGNGEISRRLPRRVSRCMAMTPHKSPSVDVLARFVASR